MWIDDVERGVMPGIRPTPWQTDTSIGDWFYNKNWKYRGTSWVIQMLVDIVSKNGNLLINVVQRPDGSLDPEAEQILAQMADWIAINGEAIYGTRPWLIHGEGPVRAKGGNFKEDFAYTAKDIRFTTKGDGTLYAFVMGWPEEKQVTIRTLAKLPGVTGKITGVTLLGSSSVVKWAHDEKGLTIQLPEQKPCDYAVAFKITGEDLRGFKPELALPTPSTVVQPDASGKYTLAPDTADLHGNLKEEARGGQANIGFWDSPKDWASWKVNFKQPGKFKVTASCATTNSGVSLMTEAAGQKLTGKVPATGAWEKFEELTLGTIEIGQAGEQVVSVRPTDAQTWKAINLRSLALTPVK
jgi:alpha-L-fucosidase